MITSAVLMNYFMTRLEFLSLTDKQMHFLFLFMRFCSIGMEKGADYGLAIIVTLAPASAKNSEQNTEGAKP